MVTKLFQITKMKIMKKFISKLRKHQLRSILRSKRLERMPSMNPLGHSYTMDANGYKVEVAYKKKKVINMSNLHLTSRFAFEKA